MKKALIIIAACNEAASLKSFLPRLMKVVNEFKAVEKIDISVVLVNDGSNDTTATVAEENGCRVVHNQRNLGIGLSLRRGYKIAMDENFDFTITMDADGQHDELVLQKMVDVLLLNQTDLVIASRYHKDSERIGVPLDRDFLNISVTAQMRVATGWNITDPLTGFWGMTRRCFLFAIEHDKQERYGVHLEHLIKFWFLCTPRPTHIEIAHPAIYKNHGTWELLTREYSAANQEQRVERFGTHALHILQSLEDVKEIIGKEIVDAEIEKRRKQRWSQ